MINDILSGRWNPSATGQKIHFFYPKYPDRYYRAFCDDRVDEGWSDEKKENYCYRCDTFIAHFNHENGTNL